MLVEKKTDELSSYRRFLDGNPRALEELVAVYSDELVRYAYCLVRDSAVAEDVMEDAFVALIIKPRHFSKGENIRAYLYKTVRNRSIDYLRANKKRVPLADLENVQGVLATEADVEKRSREKTVYRCIQQLPPQYGEVLCLAYLEDYKPSEISKIVKKSKKQVYNLLARAKALLKELLSKEGVFYEDV